MNIQRDEGVFTVTIRKTHLYVALAVVLAFGAGIGGSWLFSRSGATSAEVSDQSLLEPPQSPAVQIDIEGRPYLGPADAPVTIVEFTDYECPFCGRYFRDTLPQLQGEYEGQVKFVVMNYPLPYHPLAQPAAEAAECASDQGKFWEYHDTLFGNQDALDTDSLKKYALDLGLDTEAFKACLDSDATELRVLRDVLDGQSYGITGTPTFFINGQRLVGARPFTMFQTLIDAALGE